MNILPLVFTLLLMLSLLTIEKLDQFKNKMIVQEQYQRAIKHGERAIFNQREKRLASASDQISHRQTSFRGFFDKKDREKNQARYLQYRKVAINLIYILYGKADFFKQALATRPQLVEELLHAIEQATEEMGPNKIKKIEDVARIQLTDPQLQEVFYHMLRGTIEKEEFKAQPQKFQKQTHKLYFPLLTFFNNNESDKDIQVRLAPKELLLAIYGKEEVVNQIIESREALSQAVKSTSNELRADEASNRFRSQFLDMQIPEVTTILNYQITAQPPTRRK